MATVKTALNPPHRVCLRSAARSHGWASLEPWLWDDERGVLSRRDRLRSGRTVSIEAAQPDPGRIEAQVTGDGLDAHDVDESAGLVGRWLSVDWDPAGAIAAAREVNPKLAAIIEDGGGRFLRCSTFYEDFVKTVCTIQIAWSGSQRMASALVESIGEGVFPSPAQVLDAGESGLRGRAGVGFRARALAEATDTMLARGMMDEGGHTANGPVSYDDLLAMWGIGPYAAAHAAMLQHDFSRIPVDSAVTAFCRRRYGIEPGEIAAFFEPWGEFRFLGYRLARRPD